MPIRMDLAGRLREEEGHPQGAEAVEDMAAPEVAVATVVVLVAVVE